MENLHKKQRKINYNFYISIKYSNYNIILHLVHYYYPLLLFIIMDFINGSSISIMNRANHYYVVEWFRLKTFDDWVGTPNFPINEAAEMGLYHIKNTNFHDTVQCVHCRTVMVAWTPEDNIHAEHSKHSPNCRKGFNIPIKYKYLTQFIINSIATKENLNIDSVSDAVFDPDLENEKNDQYYLKTDIVDLYTKGTKQLQNLTDSDKEEVTAIIDDIVWRNIPDEYYLLVPENINF